MFCQALMLVGPFPAVAGQTWGFEAVCRVAVHRAALPAFGGLLGIMTRLNLDFGHLQSDNPLRYRSSRQREGSQPARLTRGGGRNPYGPMAEGDIRDPLSSPPSVIVTGDPPEKETLTCRTMGRGLDPGTRLRSSSPWGIWPGGQVIVRPGQARAAIIARPAVLQGPIARTAAISRDPPARPAGPPQELHVRTAVVHRLRARPAPETDRTADSGGRE